MSNKGVLILLVVLVAVFGVIMTCPDKSAHQNAITDKVVNIIKNDSVASATGIGTLGAGVITKFVDAAVANVVTVNNYYIFSLGTVHYGKDKVVVSIGLLHHVFCLFDKKDMEKFDTGGGESNINMEEE
ncbi:MAG: DUF4359 domain-containing protein [Bacteroidales bacterium]|nr:DUF4359 domain-containing protein [Bacteroidales bacterium]